MEARTEHPDFLRSLALARTRVCDHCLHFLCFLSRDREEEEEVGTRVSRAGEAVPGPRLVET